MQKERRDGKLSPKARSMIFVGYEPGSKGYRFWDKESRSIVLSRDVRFDENVFPNRSDNLNVPIAPPPIPKPLPAPPFDPLENDFDPPDMPMPNLPPAPVPNPPAPAAPEPIIPPAPIAPPPPVPVPAAPPMRPRRAGAGVNRNLLPGNVYGDRAPIAIERDLQNGDLNIERVSHLLMHATTHDPRTYREALHLPDRDEWELAMREELKSHEENSTWKLVNLPPGRKTVKSKWVYTYKGDGRHKARLVAKGFTQVQGIDYEETFSPVARFESIRFLLSIAALQDWEIEALDVKTAFLYGELDKEIYMDQPEGFIVPGQESKVCRLLKSIYGLKQALQTWNHKIHKTLCDLGFSCTHSDAGVYVYHHHVGDLILILYVDDLLPMGSN